MEIFQAIILGILEGFTEFLPISSTGHLIVAERAMGYKDTAEVFTVVIQLGAIAAVIWFYRSDLIDKVKGLLKRDAETVTFWINWILATIPAGIMGFLLKDQLTKYAVAATVGVTLILGGVAIWLIENYHRAKPNKTGEAELESINRIQAVKIGLFQMLALIPGVSRSGSTIMGGILSGVDRVTATAFSFYLSIPILVLAGVYQLAKHADDLSSVEGGGAALIVGTIAAFITALIAIKWLLHYVSKHDFKIFAYYRIILGIIILVTLAATQ